MNGQPYNNSGNNSANGTPTPSSTSYPASLSSHSSREASPSRLPPNLNHISPEKSAYYPPNNYSQNYKSQVDTSPNANSVNSVVYSDNHSDNINSSSSRLITSSHINNYSPNQINTSSRPVQTQSRIISSANQPSNLSLSQSKSQIATPQVLPSQIYQGQKPLGYSPGQMKSDLSSTHNKSIENFLQSNIGPSNTLPSGTSSNPQVQSGVPNQMFRSDHPTGPISANRMEPYHNKSGFQTMTPKNYFPPNQVPTETISNSPTASQSYNLTQGTSSNESLMRPTSQPSYINSYPQPSSQTTNYGLSSNPRVATSPQYPGQTLPPTPTNKPLQEPISSGPPRTNVLGIIPYNTDLTGTMAQSTMVQSTRTVTSQPIPNQMQANRGYPGYGGDVGRVVAPPPSSRLPPTPSRVPPFNNQSQPGVPPRPQQYPNQYSHRPPDNFNPQQMGQPYLSSPYQQDMSALPPYSQPGGYYPGVADDLTNQMSNLNVTQAGFNRLWGKEAFDLLKTRDILPPNKVEPPAIRLQQELHEASNCSPEIFRCTLTKIPETKALLDKSRLPLGVLIHPFKDLNQLSVIQCSVIVRCRSCRTYINPFVYFVDSKHWKCNLCFRVNDLPDEFQYDPLSKTYGDPSRRPEIKSATIEFIAPSEYMVRPPQPAAYIFVLDVSRLGAESGYLQVFCDTLLSQLEALPGDSRTSVGFITFDSSVHFYSLGENQSQPHQMVVVDIDDMFVPCPENLLVNLSECLGLVRDLLKELPTKYKESYEIGSALGPALQAAYKLLAATGGRITVFQTCLANCGPGTLSSREDPSQRTAENVTQAMLNPVTDFYKKLALDCSGQQIAVDLFILNSQYVDLASLCGVSRFSGGCIYHFPLFNIKNLQQVEALQRTLQRYLCRKIGFESVMRLRCTRGLSIHTFHGNFFVRSTDLLSLPNVNPDAGFGMQVSIDENLTDIQSVCFQAALLYTSSKGERRIRVHTLCLPIASNLSDVLHSADQQCIVGLLAKMAVDRCHQSSLSDAREAFVNVVADMLSAFRLIQSGSVSGCLLAPASLKLLPLYILAMLKYVAFRIGQSTRLDDRVFAMCQMKTLPLQLLMQAIYPDLYPIHNIMDYPEVSLGDDTVVQPPRLHLSAERIDSQGVYLMDDGDSIIIYVGHSISPTVASNLFNVPSFSSINPNINQLPDVGSRESERLKSFINYLQNEKPVAPTIQIIRDDSPQRQRFLERLVEDKTESGHSYYEFLQRVKVLLK